MLTREFTNAGHVERVTVTAREGGWDLREERNDRVVRTVRYTDWHRVERAVRVFETRNAIDGSERRDLSPRV
jgi:hypothetical protein